MKIVNYKKTKSNVYEITLDNNDKINLYDEIILKYNLLLKKEINLSLLNEMINENKYYELYNKALKYLSTKMRSEKEIYNKFKEYEHRDILQVITKLKEQGYLNDGEYIKAFINDAINLKMIGYNKIKNDLLNLGFKEEDILLYLDKVDQEIWQNKIAKLADNMIKHNHKYSLYLLKQKIISNLISKGFSKENIMEYLDSLDIQVEEAIYNKEFNKLKSKLSSKYSGEQLEFEIKKRLKAKGF